MSKIRIKNFGPIAAGYLDNEGWIDINKVNIFIGEQGSGKSSVAKLISTFTWIEKALVRGDYDTKWFERKNKFQNQCLSYHRLENYFQDDGCTIEYQGDAFNMVYKHHYLTITEVPHASYALPQIMYVPAERNFISYVKTPKELKLSSASLKEFLAEFDNAKTNIKGHLPLPVQQAAIEYDKLNDTLNLRGEGYKLKLTEASSGFLSLVPLYLVSHYLAHSVRQQIEAGNAPMSTEEMQRFKKGVEEVWGNDSLTDEQKRIALSVLSAKFNKTAFINIVEEPEQNLFPTSQQKLLYSLLEFNNLNKDNKLIITTHSPYLINYLTLAVKAHLLQSIATSEQAREKINRIVPQNSGIAPNHIAIYELGKGTISKLETFNGLPSDVNQLNEMMDKSNKLFAQLLEIQQSI